MISKILLLSTFIVTVKGTFICPPCEFWTPSTCSDDCSKIGKPCVMNTLTFFGSCKCILGYRRLNGRCVPQNLCCTGQNEAYYASGKDTNCEDFGRTFIYPKYEGCFCNRGFVRNKERKCVLPSECLPKCFRQNEEYRQNGCDRICNPDGSIQETCSTTGRCVCKTGFVRINGDCVEQNRCQSIKCPGQNEEYKINACDIICTEGSTQEVCKPSGGCVCKPGFVRIEGDCVDRNKCPETKCYGKNEEYKKTACDSICTDGSTQGVCKPTGGCVCRQGYVRIEGECIDRNRCPETKCYGNNEEYKKIACDRICTDGRTQDVCKPSGGCVCKPGFVRFEGSCIEQNKCPETKCFAQNEEYKKIACDRICTNGRTEVICKPTGGCVCKPGFVRINDECIDQGRCPSTKCPGPNEEYKNNACDNICTEGSTQEVCKPSGGCVCRRDFVRIEGECIDRSRCAETKCFGQNEEYKKLACDRICTNGNTQEVCKSSGGCVCKSGFVKIEGECVDRNKCPETKCFAQNEEYKKIACERICTNGRTEVVCKPTGRCVCKPGFVRINDECVDQGICPSTKCPGPNEEYKNNACDNICTDGSTQEVCKPSGGCVCKPGFVRIEGDCVDRNKCPETKCSGRNEEYIKIACERICTNGRTEVVCKPTGGCVCKPGFVKINDECIDQGRCPSTKCPGPNEEYKNNACDNICTDGSTQEVCKPSGGCVCRQEFVRIEGECIDRSRCAETKCFGQNEEYKKLACDRICTNGNTQEVCKSSGGCVCKPGFVKIEGECVDRNKCPETKCFAQNEEYKKIACDRICTNGRTEVVCKPTGGCVCKPGFVKINDECIDQGRCPSTKCPGPNEEYKNNACDNICTDGSTQEVCKPSGGCVCRQEFVRIEGECIDRSRCAETKCLGQNEEYKKLACDRICTNGITQEVCKSSGGCVCKPGFVKIEGECVDRNKCPETKCFAQNEEYKKIACDRICTNGRTEVVCKPTGGCVCKPGFVRINDECIDQGRCPSTKCAGLNEEYKNNACDNICTDGSTQEVCKPSGGCVCRQDFVRIEGECINRSRCAETKCFGQNEEYKKLACDRICTNGNTQEVCKPSGGCVCKLGFVKIEGECVDRNKCPETKCFAQNEEYKKIACDRICTNGRTEVVCKPTGGCVCKPGLVRINDECVDQDKCTSTKCPGPNEEYKNNACDNICTDGSTQEVCKPSGGCVCRQEFVRIEGECIDRSRCAETKCFGQNEEYKKLACDRICTNGNTQEVCKSSGGCVCKPGFVKIEGECVDRNKCPETKCFAQNEEYIKNACERVCTNGRTEVVCKPTGRCVCKPGFVRINDECVDQGICPSTKCPGPNEEYKNNACDNICTDGSTQEVCKPSGGCICKPGFVRFEGSCIEQNKCPETKCFAQNEEYKKIACDRICTNGRTEVVCKPTGGCVCKPGFVRINDECVGQSRCLPTKCPGPNEEYQIIACDRICTDGSTTEVCKLTGGCVCKPEFVRIKGNCVDKIQCQYRKCYRKNEEYRRNSCEQNCTSNGSIQEICKVAGCMCIRGYVRKNGVCVDRSQCRSQECNENEEFKKDGCEKPCFVNGNNEEECTKTSGCICKDGYLRQNDNCVQPRECKCGDNEEYVLSGGCEKDCNSETLDYGPRKCYCKEGFRRKDEICVTKEECGDCGSE